MAIRITRDTLGKGLKASAATAPGRAAAAVAYWTPRVESRARSSAPWTDRTGNARQGLTARHGTYGLAGHWIELFHTMPYGIWLEIRWAGKYAVIMPTLLKLSPQIMKTVGKAYLGVKR